MRKIIIILCLCLMLIGCQNTEVQQADNIYEENMASSITEETQENTITYEYSVEFVSAVGTAIDDEEDSDEPEMPADDLGYDPFAELLKDPYDNYMKTGGEIACMMDNGTVMDGSYNEAVYRGIQIYAISAGVSFSYYRIKDNTPKAYEDVIVHAVENNAKIIVCSGYHFQNAVGVLQNRYPEVSFLLIDGVPTGEDGNPLNIADNVHCVSFKEEQAGYLAGYMAVMEGYRKFGFIGGEKVPSVIRFGHGYMQGIDDAAQKMALSDVEINYWYSGSFNPNREIEDMAGGWYAQGTEVIFACGGFLHKSVLKAAEKYDGMVIGVDIDQSGLSERILTSAIKNVSNSVVISLDDYYAMDGYWSEEFAGQVKQYGTEENCVGIPVLGTKWRFKNVTVNEFYEIYKLVKSGDITISDKLDELPEVSVKINMVGDKSA